MATKYRQGQDSRKDQKAEVLNQRMRNKHVSTQVSEQTRVSPSPPPSPPQLPQILRAMPHPHPPTLSSNSTPSLAPVAAKASVHPRRAQPGPGLPLALSAGAAALSSCSACFAAGAIPALVVAGRAAGILGVYTASESSRTALRVGSLACLPLLRTLVPGPASTLLFPWLRVVLGLEAVGLVLRRAMPSVWRALRFWRRMLPIFIRYSVTKMRLRKLPLMLRDERWETEHEWGGERVYQLVLRMGGFYVKSAQIIASKTEFMPKPWTLRLRTLFDNVPPRPFHEVRRSMEQELLKCPAAAPAEVLPGTNTGFGHALLPGCATEDRGVPGEHEGCRGQGKRPQLEDLFERVEAEALGAASIAQVHGATLRLPQNETKDAAKGATGAEETAAAAAAITADVVIKVQHLGVEELMRSDLRNIGRVAKFLNAHLPFNLVPIVEEIQATVPLEFDFLRELGSMVRISSMLLRYGCTKIVCPRPLPGLCTQRMLVMERLYGTPFTALVKSPEVFQHSSPTSTSPSITNSRSSSFCSTSTTSTSSSSASASASVSASASASTVGSGMEDEGPVCWAPQSPLAAAGAKVAQARAALLALVEAYGVMFFVGGEFHADPHPGNLMLLPDGRLGLLDFGQSKKLDDVTQCQLARIVCSLAAGDTVGIARNLLEAGFEFGDEGKELIRPEARALLPLAALMGTKLPFAGSFSAATPAEALQSEVGVVAAQASGSGSFLPDSLRENAMDRQEPPPEKSDSGREAEAGSSPLNGAQVDVLKIYASACKLARLGCVMFDTRPSEDAMKSPMSAESLLQSMPCTAFNKSLWLVVRVVLLLRGLCHSLEMNVSAAALWSPLAEKLLKSSTGSLEKP